MALKEDIAFLAGRIHTILQALERLPHTGVHGDASPQNLLVPADGSAEFVAVDWSWNSPSAIGFDLGQLLIGRVHDGLLPAADLPAVHEAVTDGYGSVTKHDGLAGALVLRSLWTAIPVHRLTDEPDDELHAYFANRVALARYLADLGRSLDLRRSTRSQQNINTLRRTLPSPPRRRGGIHTITRKRKLR